MAAVGDDFVVQVFEVGLFCALGESGGIEDGGLGELDVFEERAGAPPVDDLGGLGLDGDKRGEVAGEVADVQAGAPFGVGGIGGFVGDDEVVAPGSVRAGVAAPFRGEDADIGVGGERAAEGVQRLGAVDEERAEGDELEEMTFVVRSVFGEGV